MPTMRSLGALLALALCLQPMLAGCLGEETVEQGPQCSLFDPAQPAGTARLDISGPNEPPANDSFVLSIADESGEVVHETRFNEDGCVGFGLPDYGTYAFTVQAEDPNEEACTWEDRVEESFTEEDGYAAVELHPRAVCR